MDKECPFCHALHWAAERLTKSSNLHPKFGTCCLQGKIELPMLQQLPTELKNLFYGSDVQSKHFLENIRSYNAAFAFVSLGLNLQPQNDPELPTSGPRQYKIKGELWHSLGSLLPPEGKPPVYAQLYFVAPETALQKHLANNQHHGTGLNPIVMQSIHDCLTHENNFINIYKSAFEIFQNLERDNPESLSTAHVKLQFSNKNDSRRYNMPTADEVAAVLPGPGGKTDYHDIILHYRAGPG